jgi:hypothetical protein
VIVSDLRDSCPEWELKGNKKTAVANFKKILIISLRTPESTLD